MGLSEIYSVQKPVQLFWSDLNDLDRILWPRKSVALQAFLPETETVSVPVENLYLIFFSI